MALRWEGLRTAVAGDTFATVHARSAVWTPLFQTLYKLPDTKGDQLRFALTRTYRPPTTADLSPRRYDTGNNSEIEVDFQGNPNLKPEVALGFDSSYEHFWADGAMESVSAWMREVDDYMRNATILADNGRYFMMPVNDGKAHARGLELETKFPLKALFANAPAVDLRASLSRNWSRVDAVEGPDNRMGQQTPFSASIGADYRAGALTLGGSFAFRHLGYLRIAQTEASYDAPRRDLEAYGVWKFDAKQQLRIGFGNLLGQTGHREPIYVNTNDTVRRIWRYDSGPTARMVYELKF